MTTNHAFYGVLADIVLVVHFAFVLFVLLGLIAIWVGALFRWSCVRNFWFRLAHALAQQIGGDLKIPRLQFRF